MDKEHEVPEFLRGVATGPEQEKQLREFCEKAYGLDYVKPKFAETREKLSQMEPEFNRQKQWISSVGQAIQKGDFKQVAQMLKIPKESVYQYALSELEFEQLPPEQKQQIERQQTMEQRLAQAEQTMQHMSRQREQEQVQQRSAQVDSLLSQEGVKDTAQQFDSRMAQKGVGKTFRELVIEQGYLITQRTGQDATPQQAIEAAMHLAAYEQGAAAPVQQRGQAPVIPHVTGRGSSPTRKAARSIEDLKARYNEL